MKDSILLFGASGFLGENLLKSIPSMQTISIRDIGWENKIPNCSVMINLIGKAHDHGMIAKEQDFYEANYEAVMDIYSVFIKSNACLLIHISSIAAVEELESKEALNELHECNPISWYGKSKRAAEEFLLGQEVIKNKKIIILRPCMVHGEGDKGNLTLLYKLISLKIPYPLSSFSNNRSFISIDNFIFYMKEIIQKSNILENGIYHISDNETISTSRIIEIIKEVLQKNIPDISVPKFIIRQLARIGDFTPFPLNTNRLKKMTSDLVVSNQKINTALNIRKLPFTAEEGLTKTIKSFQK